MNSDQPIFWFLPSPWTVGWYFLETRRRSPSLVEADHHIAPLEVTRPSARNIFLKTMRYLRVERECCPFGPRRNSK